MVDSLNIKQGKIWKKYRFRCSYCGKEEYVVLWWLKIRLIFTNKIYRHCKNCHKTNAYTNFFHMTHDSTDTKEKQLNKQKQWDKRIK